jgi:hypothetical protein
MDAHVDCDYLATLEACCSNAYGDGLAHADGRLHYTCHIVLAWILGRRSVSWAYCYGRESCKVLRVCNRYPATVQYVKYYDKLLLLLLLLLLRRLLLLLLLLLCSKR